MQYTHLYITEGKKSTSDTVKLNPNTFICMFFSLLPLHEYETNDVKTKRYFEWRHCQEEVSDDVPPKKYILHVCVFNVTLSAPLHLCDLCT